MTGIVHLFRSDPAFYVLAFLVGVGFSAWLERRTRPRKGWTPFEDNSYEGNEFDEVEGPVHAGCSAPLGCFCYGRGMRSHAERAGCVFRTEAPAFPVVWTDEFARLTPEQMRTVEQAFEGKIRDDFIEFRADKDKP